MTKKVFKSSIYNKMLYSIMAAGVLIPGLWVLFYGIEKRSYNLPLLMIDFLFCLYTVYILTRLFSYRVVITDEFIKIYDINKTTCTYYQNIIDIKISGNVCYIIDRVSRDDSFYIRGTNNKALCSSGSSVSLNAAKLPSIKRAYIEGYYEIVDTILSKCGMESAGEIAFSTAERKIPGTFFISAFLLKPEDVRQLNFKEVLEVFMPYIFMLLTFLTSLLLFGTVKKGFNYPWLVMVLKILFILYITVTICIIVHRYMPYVKKNIGSGHLKDVISLKKIILSLLVNIFISAAIIAFFFYVIKNYSI